MARRSLKSQLNQIRSWVREGRTDAWIAHQLEVSVKDIDAFKREHGLAPAGEDGNGDGPRYDDEVDLRAEDDALVAAELEAEPDEDELEEDEEELEEELEEGERPTRRRRGRRGGRGRKRRAGPRELEGTFDHGDEGYGLWLDPEVQDDAIYAEHWAGHRPVTVTIEPNRIVIRRAGEDVGDNDEDENDED
ncbi:MAG TPA: hypothetical protein VF752_04785 [Thermoleophilaceae bacterium]